MKHRSIQRTIQSDGVREKRLYLIVLDVVRTSNVIFANTLHELALILSGSGQTRYVGTIDSFARKEARLMLKCSG